MLGNVALIMGNVELKMLMYNLKYIQIDCVTESSLHSYQLVENLVSAALTYSHLKAGYPNQVQLQPNVEVKDRLLGFPTSRSWD